MKYRITRQTFAGGDLRMPGDIVELDEKQAAHLVASGKGIMEPDKPAKTAKKNA